VKALLLAALATLCFAGTEAPVSAKSIQAVEGSLNDTFRASTPESYDLLGTARGTYIPNYGTLFTMEMQLVYVAGLSPFHQAVTPQEVESIHERKMKKLPLLRQAMQNQMLNACKTLDGLPLDQHVAMEAILFNFRFEDSKGLPQRIFMTAEKGKLLEAQANHIDLSTVIQEQDR
jgi:hypothetical protein